jgi:hypothetical protein
MPLPRMTTRRWMVAAAIVALLCLLSHRRRSFAQIAAYHESRMVARMYPRSPIKGLPMGHGVRGPDITAERLAYSLAERRGNGYIYYDRAGSRMTEDDARAAIWHEAMARKYREASRYPWFPVMPDPPMPSKPTDLPEPE